MKRGNAERLGSLWKYRRIKWRNLCNAMRFHRAGRKKNAEITVGRGLRFDRKLVLRIEGQHCRLSVGDEVQSDGASTIVIGGNGSMTIGSRVYMNDGVMISCLGEVTIGDDTLIGPQVNIFDNNHRFSPEGVSRDCKPGRVFVGKNCWLAANVILLDGADIGDGCVIGAGCVIRERIPAGSIVTAERRQTIRPIERREAKR